LSFADGPLGDFLYDFYRRAPLEGTYQLDECADCALIFQRFIADGELMKRLYTDYARPAEDVPLPLHAADTHEIQSLASFLGKGRLKVLDYGTGWGGWPISARKLGHDAFATELSPHRARWVAEQGVNVIGDSEIADHRFDVINLEQVLEHVPEPLQLLRSLAPSLRGILKLSLPNSRRRHIAELARGDFRHVMAFHPYEHVNSFNRRSLAALVERVGLGEVRPSLRHLYAFRSSSPKDLARPIWRFRNPSNLYVWAMAR
jgi:SAM-dependent methyltransferase